MYLLLKDLKAAVIAVFDGTEFREPHNGKATPETYREPLVVVGGLPAKRQNAEQGEDFPFVAIRGLKGRLGEKDSVREDTVTVRFSCGVFSAGSEEDAVADLDPMIQRICHMLAVRRWWDGQRWEREMPIEWAVGIPPDHSQAHPFHGGYVEVTFSAAGACEVQNTEALGL